MTWIVVVLSADEDIVPGRWITSADLDKMWEAREWCERTLGSENILWKNDWRTSATNRWTDFRFAQSDDATLFKLKFG